MEKEKGDQSAAKKDAAERKKLIEELNLKMREAAKKLEFEEAARLRDEIAKIRKL